MNKYFTPRSVSRLFALVVGGIGGTVMFGWFLNIPLLIQINPRFVPMQFNTALSFLLCSVGLLAFSVNWKWVTAAIGVITGLISSLTLIEYFSGTPLGIDEIFMKHYITTWTPNPGQMAPNTAIGFLLSGFIYTLMPFTRFEQRWKVCGILAAVVTGIGTVSIIGYLVNISTAYGWGEYTRMAAHTSVSFMILGSGQSILSWSKERTWRYWLPLVVCILGITVTASLWQALVVSESKEAIVRAAALVLTSGLLMTIAFAGAIQAFLTSRDLSATLAMDIERRKRAEKSLQKLSSRFEVLVQSLDDAIVSFDLDKKITSWNPASEKMFGYSVDEALGKNINFIYPQERIEQENSLLQRIRQGEQVHNYETERICKDGSRIVVSITISPIRNESGKIIGTSKIARNITSEKQKEIELAQVHQLLKNNAYATDAFGVGISWVDWESGRYIYSNKVVQERLGYTADEMKQLYVWDINSNYSLNSYQTLAVKAQTEGKITLESTHRTHDGATIPVELNIHYQNADEHFSARNIVFSIDISERKRAESEREKMQAQLNQAQKMESVGRLAGGVAHDFNNMLSVILGYTEIALDKIDSTHLLFSSLEAIQQAAQHSADLTRQLLMFARQQAVAPKILDINDTIEGMLNMLRRLIGEDIDLFWKPGSNVWPIKMDPAQLGQLLTNLCVNARDAIEGVGKIIIETNVVSIDTDYCEMHVGTVPGNYVQLAVTDTGCGMDNKTIGHIFEPFFTTKKQGKGTGLGLASAYGIVKQNNGFINVYSELGQGTTLKIYLPRHTVESQGEEEIIKEQKFECGQENILLVEDEPAILEMTTIILEGLGYSVVAANTPREAIRLAQEHSNRIDLLITDVIMPQMNGLELANELADFYPSIKHLFMSGYTANVIAQHGVLSEGVHFIQKPFSKKDLAAKVHETLTT